MKASLLAAFYTLHKGDDNTGGKNAILPSSLD